MSIQLHVGNATGELSHLIPTIQSAFKIAAKEATNRLGANNIDVFVINATYYVIEGYGCGGFTPAAHTVYINVDKKQKKLDKQLLVSLLLHELHHAVRWGTKGYGETLGEALVTEGLACLIEEEYSGEAPAYTQVTVPQTTLNKLVEDLNSKQYDHNAWFFGYGTIPKWAGYTIGYQLCKNYSKQKNITAAELVSIDASKILDHAQKSKLLKAKS